MTFFIPSPSHKLQIRANIIWEGREKYANEKWRFFARVAPSRFCMHFGR